MTDPYYRYHLFFCLNQREDGGQCCTDYNAEALFEYAKKRSKALNLAGKGGVRVNRAGCLNRCSEGPVAVVYPQGTWYTFIDEEDIDDIVDQHLTLGKPVERLMLPGIDESSE